MSNVCEICGKGKMKGHYVSHSNRKTNRSYKPNLQTTKVSTESGKIVNLKVCTKCLKSMRPDRSADRA